METCALGASGMKASRLGLGCVTFGREVDESTAFRLMDYAFERGITLFDTAESYGGGEARSYRKSVYGLEDEREVSGEQHSSEKILGRWLQSRGVRKDIVLVTKISTNFREEHLLNSLRNSLERLQTDSVDVYMFHSFDPDTPSEDAAVALDAAVRRKMTRTIGCSNYTASQMQSLLDAATRLELSRLQVVELPYNLLEREIESDILPICQQQRIGVLGYSPLAAGFLTGKYSRDLNLLPRGSRFHVIPGHVDQYFKESNFRSVERLHLLSARFGLRPEKVALAWALHQSVISSVLVGATAIEHLQNALDAHAIMLAPELLRELNPLSQD